jgi:ubiquinone/menaquinone biosynthesis C-methylase UbiE
MKKQGISSFLRSLRVLHLADKVRFYIQKFKNRKANKAFKAKHPNVILPPDYLIYESFQLDYHKYYVQSKDGARNLVQLFAKHIDLTNKKILDWGCGPGRIVRHLPELVGNNCTYYGTDYNARTIAWCSQNLPDIQFNNNTLEASLPYEDNFFDVIYGLSIFTHLSAVMHKEWYAELYRVLKPGGILLLTTQGDTHRSKMTAAELEQYNQGELVVRGQVKEGHRIFSAFQPRQFMNSLFSNATVMEHIEKPPMDGWYPQDKWIVRK